MARFVQEQRSVLVAAHVDRDTHAQLLELARTQDRSLASVLRILIGRELDRELRSAHYDEQEGA